MSVFWRCNSCNGHREKLYYSFPPARDIPQVAQSFLFEALTNFVQPNEDKKNRIDAIKFCHVLQSRQLEAKENIQSTTSWN